MLLYVERLHVGAHAERDSAKGQNTTLTSNLYAHTHTLRHLPASPACTASKAASASILVSDDAPYQVSPLYVGVRCWRSIGNVPRTAGNRTVVGRQGVMLQNGDAKWSPGPVVDAISS